MIDVLHFHLSMSLKLKNNPETRIIEFHTTIVDLSLYRDVFLKEECSHRRSPSIHFRKRVPSSW